MCGMVSRSRCRYLTTSTEKSGERELVIEIASACVDQTNTKSFDEIMECFQQRNDKKVMKIIRYSINRTCADTVEPKKFMTVYPGVFRISSGNAVQPNFCPHLDTVRFTLPLYIRHLFLPHAVGNNSMQLNYSAVCHISLIPWLIRTNGWRRQSLRSIGVPIRVLRSIPIWAGLSWRHGIASMS